MRFMQVMEKIDDFLKNTPEDIFEFSIELEDILVDDYDEMQSEQPLATYYLSQEVPGICASAEPGMSKTEIDKFKKRLQSEYELDRYEKILHGIGIETAELNLYLLDTKILMALLMAMVESTEHMIDYCRSGDIQFLLHLLKEADNNDSETLGALKEIRLVSENNAFWPDGDGESRWKLTISKKGLVHLTKYVSVGVDKYKIIGKEKIAIELDAVETIIDMVGMWFENYEKENFIICNCPMWRLTLINDDGKHFVIHGPMKESVLPDLSGFIREELQQVRKKRLKVIRWQSRAS